MNDRVRNRQKWVWLFPIELALFAFVFWADEAGYIPLSKTPVLLAIAWISLWARRQTWKSVGLCLSAGWLKMIVGGLVAGVAIWAFEYYVQNALVHALFGTHPDLSEFRPLVGNVQLLVLFLLLNLVLAGFGEEMVWRGYALPRVAQIFGGRALGWGLALLLVNTAFGLAHMYQGPSGVIQAGVSGVWLGVLYLAMGRNLIAPIVAHVTSNTCDFVLIFLGVHVGLAGTGI